MSTNLDQILAAAKEQSQNVQALVPAGGSALTPLPSQVPAMAFDMSADAFLNAGGMEVESYIQVKDAGIRLSKDWTGFIDSFEAVVDMSEVQFFMGIRKEVGNAVSYAKSYDGRTTTRGENFAQVVAEFQATSQKPADPYRGADIPMVLVEDMTDPKDKSKTLAAGTRVGLSTSITGFKPYASFARKIEQAGLGSSVLRIRVNHSPRRNAANQEYGVCEFDLVEIVEDNRPSAVA